jgi:hypothetical protein
MQLRFFESAADMSSSLAKGKIFITTLKAYAIKIFKSANLTQKITERSSIFAFARLNYFLLKTYKQTKKATKGTTP